MGTVISAHNRHEHVTRTSGVSMTVRGKAYYMKGKDDLETGCSSHRRSQDFCWEGAPGRRHPTLHQSCTRLKLSRAAGDSLVFIFPLAPMLTFTSAVGKLNVRVLWHHHMLLQVISQRYCQVFVKSYNFVFEKIDKEGSPVKSDQNKAISVHVLWVSFHHRSTPVLSSSHQKINFLHYISVTAVKCTIAPVQRNSF